jgi:peroxiredoxin
LYVGCDAAHHRRHHGSERRLAPKCQNRCVELAFGEIGLAVEGILAEGRELSETCANRPRPRIQRGVVSARCRVEMPWFEEFSRTYASRGLVVIGVSLDDGGWKAVHPAISKLKVSYPIVLGDGKVTKSYGMGDPLPATFLIERTGRIRAVKVGFGDKVEFEKTIEQLLQEK